MSSTLNPAMNLQPGLWKSTCLLHFMFLFTHHFTSDNLSEPDSAQWSCLLGSCQRNLALKLKLKHMKSSTIITTLGLMALALTLNLSCQRQEQFEKNAGLGTRSVMVEANNWSWTGNGTYETDFGDALQKASGGYNTIVDAYIRAQGGDVKVGTPIPALSGTLTRSGTILIYRPELSGQAPFKLLSLKVIVN